MILSSRESGANQAQGGITDTDTEVCLLGDTLDGERLLGCDAIRSVAD